MSFRIDQINGIVQFQITRPQIHNAVNHEVIEGLALFIERLKQPDVHLGVFTGEGDKAFCSGGDLSVFHSLVSEAEAWEIHSKMASLLYELAVQPVPVIALVNGTAIGGGAEIASACDYRLMRASAKAGFVQGRLAITSGWGGTTLLLEKGMRYDLLLQMTTEAEPLTAERLLEIGWATELYEGDKWAALSDFVNKMKAIHPSVAKAYKEILTSKIRDTNVKERMLAEARLCSVLWEKEPHHQAVADFLNRKK